MKGYWFTSLLFKIEPGEDEEINPGRYGRRLSIWLKKQLEGRGHSIEPIINEDWGRCLMCSRDPFRNSRPIFRRSPAGPFAVLPHHRLGVLPLGSP
jgi:hypothetical protein